MTNLNEVEIVACIEAPNGEQQAITDTAPGLPTTPQGQIIATVPGDQNQWAECTIDACNLHATLAQLLYIRWGNDNNSALIAHLLPALSGLRIVVDGRVLRGGLKIRAYVTTSTGAASGTADIVNVCVRPFILHKKSKADETT